MEGQHLSDTQTWTIIALLATTLISTMVLMTTMLNRTLKAAIGGLRGEMNARFDHVDFRFELVDKRFEQVDKRFAQVDKRFEQMDQRFDKLDKDVQFLDKRLPD